MFRLKENFEAPTFVMQPGWFFMCVSCGNKENLSGYDLLKAIEGGDQTTQPVVAYTDPLTTSHDTATSEASWQEVHTRDVDMESVTGSVVTAQSETDEDKLRAQVQELEESCNAWNHKLKLHA